MFMKITVEHARELDAIDELKDFRERFHIPRHEGEDCLYFTGNSLGLQPKNVRQHLDEELTAWAELGVEGHFLGQRPWWRAHEELARLSMPVVGALEHEIVVMNTLTVNLHLLLTTFYRPTPDKYKILCEGKAFPSDQYAFESQVKLHGYDPATAIVEVWPHEGEVSLRTEDIEAAIAAHSGELALVFFGGLNYYTGQVFDMQAITAAAHRAGVPAGFDLAHAAGNVELKLHDWDVDFAAWCSYKYLNSSPGGISGMYLHERHARNRDLPRLAGWWGYDRDTRFKMQPGFQPMASAEGWMLSNGPALLQAAHRASLEVFAEAGMEALLRKSRSLTQFLFSVLDEVNEGAGGNALRILTPREKGRHGCQASVLMLRDGRKVFDFLMGRGAIVDWREPDVIRIAPVPLYNTYEDVYRVGELLKEGLLASS